MDNKDNDDIENYQRTTVDVKSMIEYAKLDENQLTKITQAIYYTKADENHLQSLKLLELNSYLLEKIQVGELLEFKGGLNEKIVLCTSDKTYDVKEAEISNSILLIPDLKLTPPRTNKSPSNNRSVDQLLNDSIEEETMIIDHDRELEHRIVSKVFHEYLEVREIKPRYRKLYDLLQLTRYSGPENEQFIDRNLLFTYEKLLNTIQCSRKEFDVGLLMYRAITINNRVRILELKYECRIIHLMLALIQENSWLPNEIDKIETISALENIAPKEILEGLFDLYTVEVNINPNVIKYEYQEHMICRIIAQNILVQHGLKFHIDEFMQTWQEALPEGMNINESYLLGIGIVDRESQPSCVRALIENNLPTNLPMRLQSLFSIKEQWTLEQIQPYIEYFETPQLTVTAILAKFARSKTDSKTKRRIYMAKY